MGLFCLQYYSSEIAPVGQVPAQEPQEMQAVASISNLPSPSEIAPTGQEPAQAPQDTQLSPITNAIIIILLLLSELYCLLVKYLNKYILKQVYIDSKFFLQRNISHRFYALAESSCLRRFAAFRIISLA